MTIKNKKEKSKKENRKKDVIASYLDTYGEKEHLYAKELKIQKSRYCLVIPAYNENWKNIQKVWGHLNGTWLIILVVNSPPGAGFSGEVLLNSIQEDCVCMGKVQNLNHYPFSEGIDLLTVNRCSAGYEISPNQGVGLARKIGADIALSFIHSEKIERPLIFTTDADAELPADYGQVENGSYAAAIFPFVHSAEASLDTALNLYEISMYYYVLGLRWAGSAYAFCTVGSTLTLDARHYAQVRGFPKRNAAEDFYILNKLAKTGAITQLGQPVIKIRARHSDRVPFGTGPALRKINSEKNPSKDYLFYHPSVFIALRYFLLLQDHLWSSQELSKLLMNIPSTYRDTVRQWCETSHFEELIRKKRLMLKSEPTFRKFLHDWFDGFKTLKFIHFARDRHFPSAPLEEMLKDNPVIEQLGIESGLPLANIKENLANNYICPDVKC